MYLQLSTYIYIYNFRSWPMQGIRTRHGHLDLRSKNGKTSWNAIEFALLAFNFFLWKCVTFKSDKYRTGDFTRPKPSVFLMHDFPLARSIFQLKPIQGQIQTFQQILAITTNRCVTVEDIWTWNSWCKKTLLASCEIVWVRQASNALG